TLSLPTSKPHSLWNHPWVHAKFSSTATATTCSRSKGNSFTASYLIETCGFSPQRALSVSKHLNFKTNEKPELPKIDYFKSKGVSDPDIRLIMMSWPSILLRSLENEIIPSFDFLCSMLQSNQNLTKVLIRHAGVLYGFGKCLQPKFLVNKLGCTPCVIS
ncbi:hypothetical protein PIB30_112487, partial [Stylosanthes scabra]|nr:hypothetical protein [Stylosanthes scabra]